jgi:hypothetical protein
MTGFQLRTMTTLQGTWNVTLDSLRSDYKWSHINWSQVQANPEGTSLEIAVRTASTEAGLGSQTYTRIYRSATDGSNASNSAPINLTGRFLQVELKFLTKTAGTTPEISTLSIH